MMRMLTSLALLALAVLAATRPAMADSPRTFASPEEAGAALAAAFEANDDAALKAMVGQGADEIIGRGSDPVVAASRKDLAAATRTKLAVDRPEAARAILLLGDDGWPLPIPLVQEGTTWRFDGAAGKEEVLARVIGGNELRALGICMDYLDMQVAYAAEDRDGDEVREYAQRLGSTAGAHDGLYWVDSTGDDPSPMGLELADVATPKAGEPYGGYFWRVLTSQGPNAPGGAHSYVINGNMIAGFGLVGAPAEYRKTGVMTFIVSNHGTVYQKDLGAQSLETAKAMTAFDPDSSWTEIEAEEELASAK